jgi:hypothetical protein
MYRCGFIAGVDVHRHYFSYSGGTGVVSIRV